MGCVNGEESCQLLNGATSVTVPTDGPPTGPGKLAGGPPAGGQDPALYCD